MTAPIGLMEAGGPSQEAPVYATTLILVRHAYVLTTLTVVLAVRLDTCLMPTGMFALVLTPCIRTHTERHSVTVECGDTMVSNTALGNIMQ